MNLWRKAQNQGPEAPRRGPGLARRWHRWMGLGAGLWLAVLGATGFALDHREWRWMWQSSLPAVWFPGKIVRQAEVGTFRVWRQDPANPARQMAAGLRGAWVTPDGGTVWTPVEFMASGGMPQVYAVVSAEGAAWGRFLLATDDGLWELNGGTARRLALAGQTITALGPGGRLGQVLGVEDKSRVFVWENNTLVWIHLSSLALGVLPQEVTLARFVRDLHYGRGLLPAGWSLWVNDFGGVALVMLPLTGFLFWWWPRHWRQRHHQEKPTPSPQGKKARMRWSFRLHGPLVGLPALVALLYLGVSGIILDHGEGLEHWLFSTRLHRSVLPPVYDLPSWRGEVTAVMGMTGQTEGLMVGTRMGLFSSTQGGADWMPATPPGAKAGFVYLLARQGNEQAVGGMGSPNYIIRGGGWEKTKPSAHMPTDAWRDPQGRWVWVAHGKVHGPEDGKPTAARWPQLGGVPLFYLLDGLHTGRLFTPQWKWVNDAAAGALLLLAVSGVIQWWRKKWA
ncbi:MAG: PepSY domain-containing protein [Deltaproteobacteria bacterium]|nr:PepSY domain-containing protein [Deltaproteobacteria bacterium]